MLHRATVWILTAVITAYAGAGPASERATRAHFSIARSAVDRVERPVLRFRTLRLFVTKVIQWPGEAQPFLVRIASHSLYHRPPPAFLVAV